MTKRRFSVKFASVRFLQKYILSFAVFCGPAHGAPHCKEAFSLSEPERAMALFDGHYEKIKNSGITADIDPSKLKILPSPGKGEHSNVSLKAARLEEQEVLLKPIGKNNTDDRNHRGKRELAVWLTLRELKAPVLFEGVFRDESEEFFIVSRFQEGDLWLLDKIHKWRWKNSCRYATNRTYQDLSALKELFLRYHIMPWDMQVIVSPKTGAAYIIDVEHYEFFGGRPREKISLADFRQADTDQMRKHATLVGEVFSLSQRYSLEATIKLLETRRRTPREFIKFDWSGRFDIPGTFLQKARFFCANPLDASRLF